jgi:hypothetical protein
MEEALRIINEHLSLELGLTCRGDEVKGIRPDSDDGGVCNLYLNKRDLLALGAAFIALASSIKEES